MRLQNLLIDILKGAIALWFGLFVLWMLLKYAQRLPAPLAGFAASAQKLATPGGV